MWWQVKGCRAEASWGSEGVEWLCCALSVAHPVISAALPVHATRGQMQWYVC